MNQMYNKYYSEFFLKEACFTMEHYEKECKRLSVFMPQLLPKDKNVRIWELGSGIGFLLHYLQKNGYHNFYGVDISKEAVDLCRQNVTNKINHEDVLVFLQKQQEDRQTADCIIAFDILEHLEKKDILDIFQLCFSLLSPNGIFIIKVGNLSHLTGSQLFYHDFTHLTGFTEGSLRHLFFQSGFKELTFYQQKPILLRSKIKYYLERCLHRWIYGLSRVKCPEVTTRKIIAIGKKGE